MIRLQRVRTQQAVARAFTGRGLQANSLCLLRRERMIRRGTLARHSFSRNVWKTAKPQLLRESHGKCAYCESPTDVVSYGDVEHYRPKSKYWWLAYCLDNLLASCALCNQRFKGGAFPYDGKNMSAPRIAKNSTNSHLRNLARKAPDTLDAKSVSSFKILHGLEQPRLINPYFDDPAVHFAWRADAFLEEVKAVPARAGSSKYVTAAENLYGINRWELKRNRFLMFRPYRVLRDVLSSNRLSARRRAAISAELSGMAQADRPYAGVIRFFSQAGSPADWVRDGFLVE